MLATVAALIRKDFVRRWRSPISTISLLIFPFMMSGMMGMISSGSSGGIPEITVFVLDRDDGLIGGLLTEGPQPPEGELALNLVKVGEEGFARMERGEASAMIVLEEGFTERALDGEAVEFRLVRNPAESIKPEIVEQGLIVLSTYIDVVVKVLGEELGEFTDMIDADEMPTMLAVTNLSSRVFKRLKAGERYLFPPVVEINSIKEGADEDGEVEAGPNVFGYVLVMVAVMSVLFAATRAISEIYEERKTGMVRRVLSTPVPVTMFIGSKILFAVLFGMTVMGILLLAGGVLGWFGSAVPVAGVLVHTAAFSLAAAGLMVVVIGLVRTEKQAGIFSWILVMTMSAIGGSMFPAENLPAAMQGLARFTLNYWAVEGYLDMIVRGVSPAEVLRTSAGLGVVGVGLVSVGMLLMRVRVREALA
jgi:ABC-2 type transport system permease protein